MFRPNDYDDFVKTLSKATPEGCPFSVGDQVSYTNFNGLVFTGFTVIGFSVDEDLPDQIIHLDKDAWWYPVKASELTLERSFIPMNGIR